MGNCSAKEVGLQPTTDIINRETVNLEITTVDYGPEGRLVDDHIALLKKSTVGVTANTVQSQKPVNFAPNCETSLTVDGACVLKITFWQDKPSTKEEEREEEPEEIKEKGQTKGESEEKREDGLGSKVNISVEDGFDGTLSSRTLCVEEGKLHYDGKALRDWNGSDPAWIEVAVLFGKPTLSITTDGSLVEWDSKCGCHMTVDEGVAKAGVTSGTFIGLTEPVRPYVTYDVHWNMGMVLTNRPSNDFGFFRIAILTEAPEPSKLREFSLFNDAEEKEKTWSLCSAVRKFPYSGIVSFRIADGQIEHNLALESLGSTTWSPLQIIPTGPVYLLFELFFGKVNITESKRPDRCVKQELKLPAIWEASCHGERVRQVQLTPGSDQYLDCEGMFYEGFLNYPTAPQPKQILNMYRIESYALYQMYEFRKLKLDNRNPKDHQNERQLWHGSTDDIVPLINEFGFSRQLCDRHATVWGQGVYFATTSGHAGRDTHTAADDNNIRRMYLCRVLTGVYTKAVGTMKALPQKPGSGGVPYDSAVDDFRKPSIFVIFDDYQAYPEYLIEYET